MNISIQDRTRILRWTASISVTIVLLCMAFQNYPHLLGAWESFTFYKTYGALDPGLSFRISPRANIAYEGYALLEIGRYITDIIGWDFITFRLPVIIYGLISLLIFFVCAKRWFGYWPALGATLLMGLNPIFLVYQHQMIVVMVTFLLLLFVFERLQNLQANSHRYISWVTLGIASAFCALHYGPGRHLMIYLIGVFIVMQLIVASSADGIGPFITRKRLSSLILFIVSFLGCLILMNPLNIWDILHFKNYVFPAGSEGSVSWFEIKNSLSINIPLILESFSGCVGGKYHSEFSTDVIIDQRYPLLPFIMFLPFMVGLILCLTKPRDRRYFVIHYLLLAATVPMVFSWIVSNPLDDHQSSTLSTHRLFYVLIPVYLYIAAFINRIAEMHFFRNRLIINWSLAGIILFCAGMQITSFEVEKKRFNSLINTVIANSGSDPLSDQLVFSLFKDSRTATDPPARFYRYYSDQLQYLPVVQQVGKEVKDEDIKAGTAVILIPVSLNKLNSNISIPYYPNLNFHSVYLSLYLADRGINTGFIQVVTPVLERSWLIDGARWLVGGSEGRFFSAPMEKVGNQLQYGKPAPPPEERDRNFWKRFRRFVVAYLTISSDKLDYKLRQTQRNFPEVIITTTDDEMEAAKSILKSMRKEFRVLQPI